ncbi:hypothetical protein ON010_g3027 [Phytophthora cinnamomi]|nr:hypothetical protein ON010_g3027 [Phytophthora cinnamomi]
MNTGERRYVRASDRRLAEVAAQAAARIDLDTLRHARAVPGGAGGGQDRTLIADYLLRQGYLESAKIVEDTKGPSNGESDRVVLTEWLAASTAAVSGRVPPAAAGFHRVRARSQAARCCAALRDSAIGEVQVAMATLAYEAPEKCGIEAYEKVFSMDRWLVLEKMFLKTFNDVYGMHDPPSLCIALHAGLSTLNTRACHLARDANLKARLARSGARGKRPRREGDEGTGATADDGKDSGNESDEVWFKPSSKGDGSTSPSQSTNNSPGSKKRKHCHTDSPVPICPACSEVGSQLCTGLPFAYHPHSRLVCRVTQSVMDEHNPPLVLPNGRVYSKRGIELLTQRSTDGMIKCMDTHDVFSPTDVKPVYIL